MTQERQKALIFIEPKIPSIKSRVRKAITDSSNGLTAKELSLYLGVKVHTVTGRLDELQDAGIVFGKVIGTAETKYCPSKDTDIHIHSEQRKVEKFETWLKYRMNRYADFIAKDTFRRIHEDASRSMKIRFKNK
jgi:hypothetical protein